MYPIPFASPAQIVQIAQHAEALGFDSVWGNDHMTTQSYVRKDHARPPRFWEPLITYAYAAAKTTTLRFGTGLLVTPMRRDIVVVAKQLVTLDHFSKGRLTAALGVGAYREEFEALHPDWKVHRGDMLEESVQALQMLFREPVATWTGRYYQFKDVHMAPKPLQDPLPIYIGGNNPNAVRRTALYAQGWLPAAMPVEMLRERIGLLRELADEQGRDYKDIDVAVQYVTYIGRTQEAALERFRRSQMYEHLVSLGASTLKEQAGRKHEEINLIGTPDSVLEKIKELEAAGVTHLCGLYFCADDVAELLDQMQIFADEIIPHLTT